jgi:hypothetical protein
MKSEGDCKRNTVPSDDIVYKKHESVCSNEGCPHFDFSSRAWPLSTRPHSTPIQKHHLFAACPLPLIPLLIIIRKRFV